MNNIKYIICFVLCATLANIVSGQGKYIEKKGSIIFEASEELFEPVKATNSSVTAILNTETGDIASLALIKGFRFKNSLMEEHFNENYIESETYPKATFKGKLLDFDFSKLSEKETVFNVEGTLELHGQSKQIKAPLTLKLAGENILIVGTFKVTPADFAIEIPSIVRNKIAKEINVDFDFNLSKK